MNRTKIFVSNSFYLRQETFERDLNDFTDTIEEEGWEVADIKYLKDDEGYYFAFIRASRPAQNEKNKD